MAFSSLPEASSGVREFVLLVVSLDLICGLLVCGSLSSRASSDESGHVSLPRSLLSSSLLDNLGLCANLVDMDKKLARMLGKDGSFDVGDRRPSPLVNGAKAGAGGIKVTSTETPAIPTAPRRYAFKIEGTAPQGVILTDVVTMLEARFQGDPKFNLRHSHDEAVSKLKERMEKRLTRLKETEDRATRAADDLEAKRAAYEATKEEIAKDALKDVQEKRNQMEAGIREAEQEAQDLRNQIQVLRNELNETRADVTDRRAAMEAGQDRVLRSMSTDAMDEPYLTVEQSRDMAEALVRTWLESLGDPEEMPMQSEFDDLTGMLSKLLSKTVGKVNDKWRDVGKAVPVVAAPTRKDPAGRSGSGNPLF